MNETDNTNSKHLELYSIMAEYDNAGFPLSYCLLSTATAIDQQKRTKALAAWATCLRDIYGLSPVFAHVDKDMAEIGSLKEVWKSKISLCWWHLRRAIRMRLILSSSWSSQKQLGQDQLLLGTHPTLSKLKSLLQPRKHQ